MDRFTVPTRPRFTIDREWAFIASLGAAAVLILVVALRVVGS